MLYAVEPTLASELDRGAIVRGGCRNLRVTKVTTSDHRVIFSGERAEFGLEDEI